MKLERFKGFVRKLNEEREAPEYDTLTDFRREMGKDLDETDLDEFGSEEDEFDADEEDDNLPVPGSDDEDDDLSKQDKLDTDVDMDSFSEEEDGDILEPADKSTDARFEPRREMGDFSEDDLDDDFEPQYMPDEMKLQKLADMLGVEVDNNQVHFGDQVVNFYSETNNLHIGNKEFETPEEAAKYLKGGQARMVRDTSESRSYRFKRRK